eukprot:11195927-Lingulodinium_polyedra.AAC.1
MVDATTPITRRVCGQTCLNWRAGDKDATSYLKSKLVIEAVHELIALVQRFFSSAIARPRQIENI